MSPTIFERWAARVLPQANGCWFWSGRIRAEGYGEMLLSGRGVGAHRLSYMLNVGPIADGLLVCHDCDKEYPRGDKTYRRCVNPAHLFLGTTRDNMRDMVAKGRNAMVSCGAHPRAGTCDGNVRVMIMLAHERVDTLRAIGSTFNMSLSATRMISCGANWSELRSSK